MLGAKSYVGTVCGYRRITDQTNVTRSISISVGSSWFHPSIRLGFRTRRRCEPKLILISCKSSPGSFDSRSNNADDDHHEYLEASLLISETISHYRMRRQGYKEEIKWKSSGHLHPFSVQAKELRAGISSITPGFLHRFQSPTIFLKISCDGDFLLPIIVGELSVENLIDALWGDDNGESPDQFQFVRNVVENLGYEVKMVRITERVVNTYFAKLDFGKPGKNDILSVDVRPSDAINVANRCKAPIYVSKEIVVTDAIKIGYGIGRLRDGKSTFDVSLDSAADGPDLLTEELDLVRNMNLAVDEESHMEGQTNEASQVKT